MAGEAAGLPARERPRFSNEATTGILWQTDQSCSASVESDEEIGTCTCDKDNNYLTHPVPANLRFAPRLDQAFLSRITGPQKEN
jgi:hypothetical protein